jgi:uncharacterized protein with HEPN domain
MMRPRCWTSFWHVARFIGQADETSFLKDERTQWAVASQFTLIGEAAKRLSESFRDEHAAIPWLKVMGMRNRVVHGYDKIDWVLVWTTAKRDIRQLLESLETLVPPEDKSS